MINVEVMYVSLNRSGGYEIVTVLFNGEIGHLLRKTLPNTNIAWRIRKTIKAGRRTLVNHIATPSFVKPLLEQIEQAYQCYKKQKKH